MTQLSTKKIRKAIQSLHFLNILHIPLLLFFLISLASFFSEPNHFTIPDEALNKTRAFSSATSLYTLNQFKRICHIFILNYNPARRNVKVTNGTSLSTCGSFRVRFTIANENLQEKFPILKPIN